MMNNKFLRSPIVFLVGGLSSMILSGGAILFFESELAPSEFWFFLPGFLFGLLVFTLGVLNGVGSRGLWWVVASTASWPLAFMSAIYLSSPTFTSSFAFKLELAIGLGGLVGGLVLFIAGRFIHGKARLSGEVSASALVIAFLIPVVLVSLLPTNAFTLNGNDRYIFFVQVLWQASALVMIDLLMRYSSRQA